MIGHNGLLIGALIILTLCLAPAASASGTDGFNGTVIHVPADYPSIQAAIDAASDGDTIVVENGTYNEHLNVTASVMIAGVGMPVVNATGTGSAITVAADGVCLSGIAVTGAGSVFNSTAYDAGIQVLGDDALIENCSSDQNGACGIFVSDADGAVVQVTEVSDNPSGMIFWYCSRVAVTANTVHDNGWLGIEVDETDGAVLDDNVVSDNGGFGIDLWYVADLTMQDNVMAGNTWNFGYYGDDPAPGNSIDTSNTVDGLPVVYLEGVSGMTIDPSSNAGAVCCVGCDNMAVEGLALQDSGFGVALLSTRDSSIEGCTIADTYDGIHLSNVSGIAVEGCSITASKMDEWLLNIGGAVNCSLIGNTLAGYGYSGMGLYTVSGTEITGNTVRFTASDDDQAYVDISVLNNSTVTENLLDFSGADMDVGDLRDNEIYLNDITLPILDPVPGAAEQAVSSSARSLAGRPAGHAHTLFDSDASATDIYSTSIADVPNENVWDSPDPVVYRYDGVLFQNFTGNHWNLYDGTDANDDGIGDSPYVIGSEDQDDYPLMASFAAYTAPLTIYVPQDVPTIGDALDIAQDGDSVVVSAGTYNESVWIDRSVSVTGVGMPVVRDVYIDGDGAVFDGFAVVDSFGNGVGIDIGALDVVVRNNVVTGNWLGIGIAYSGNLTLENNTMTNNTYNFAYMDSDPAPGNSIDTSNTVDGLPIVYLEGVSGAEVPADAGAVVCVNCSDMTIAGLSLDHLYTGVVLINSSGVTVEDCAIADSYYGALIAFSSDCGIAGSTVENSRYGVYTVYSEGMILSNCSITDGGMGLMFGESTGASVRDVRVDGASSGGVGVIMSDAFTLSDSSINASQYGLMALIGSNCTVENNTFGGCPEVGMGLEILDNATVTMNTVNNASGCALIYDVWNSTISKNTFSGLNASIIAADLQGTDVYLNNFINTSSGPVSIVIYMSEAARSPDQGQGWESDPFAGSADPFSFPWDGSADSLRAVSAVAPAAAGTWHSPEIRNYYYNGTVCANFTGNYWSAYDGTDANGDGIGDVAYVYINNVTDSYPLMERFEGYAVPVAAFAAAPLSGSAPLTVRFTDTSAGEPESWLWSFGDGATSTEQNPAHVYHAGGKHTVTLTASNRYGSDTLVFPDLITVDQSSTSSGGGSTSAASASAASGLVAGQSYTLSMTSGGTPISGIVITPSTGIPAIMITVDVSSLPPGAAPPAGDIMQYVQINVYRASEDEIGSGEIEFTVSKAWLESLGLTPADVVIYRYHDGEWVSLPVEQTGEDATSFTFIATTPGFSVFAIGAVAGAGSVPASEANVTPAETVTVAEPPSTAETLPAATQQSPLGAMTALLAACGGVCVFLGRRR